MKSACRRLEAAGVPAENFKSAEILALSDWISLARNIQRNW
jgi:hypothetical protein